MKNEEFGKKLRTLRKERKMTQQEVADYCGVSLRTYSDWETKGTIPRNNEKLIKLEELFGTGAFLEDATKVDFKETIIILKGLKAWHENSIRNIDNLISLLA